MSRHCNVATAKSDEGRNTIDDQTGCKQANKPLCLMAKQKTEQMWNASKSTSCSDLRQAHVSNLNQGVCFLMNSLGDNFIVCLLQLVYKLSNCPTAHYCAIYDLFLVMSLHF